MANNGVQFELIGGDIIENILKQLPAQLNNKVLYDINRKGATIAKKIIEDAAPDGNNDKASSKKIANNVTIVKNDTNPTGALVGFKKDAYQVIFVEKGTKVRKTKGGKGKKYKAGANRGKMVRRPFVEQAHQNAAGKVIEFISNNYAKIIDRTIKRQLKKLSK